MSLNYEMARYTELTGHDGTKVPISRLGGYLDGYEKGRADEREHIVSILFGIDSQVAELVKEILNNEQNTGRKL